MQVLSEASSSHSVTAASQIAGTCGMATSASVASTAPARKIRPPPAEARPGAVAEMPDERLHQQPGQRRGDPHQAELVERRAERLEDAAGVGVLQRETDLDAEEAERQVPQAPPALPWPGHAARAGRQAGRALGRGRES